MTDISFKDLPYEIQVNFLKHKIDMIIDIMEKSGLLKEFHEFVFSHQFVEPVGRENVDMMDTIFKNFAKKYPDKFKISPDQYSSVKIVMCDTRKKND